MTTTTDNARPMIKNDPENYRTRASLASAPTRSREVTAPAHDSESAFVTAPIDEAGYIRFDLVPSQDAE